MRSLVCRSTDFERKGNQNQDGQKRYLYKISELQVLEVKNGHYHDGRYQYGQIRDTFVKSLNIRHLR